MKKAEREGAAAPRCNKRERCIPPLPRPVEASWHGVAKRVNVTTAWRRRPNDPPIKMGGGEIWTEYLAHTNGAAICLKDTLTAWLETCEHTEGYIQQYPASDPFWWMRTWRNLSGASGNTRDPRQHLCIVKAVTFKTITYLGFCLIIDIFCNILTAQPRDSIRSWDSLIWLV